MLKNNKSRLLGTIAAALALGAFVASGAAWAGGGTRLETELSGDTLASGKAKWEHRGNRTKLSVEAEDLTGITATVSVFCETTWATSVAVDNGFFDLNLDSRVDRDVPNCDTTGSVTVAFDGGNTITGIFDFK